MIKFANPDTSRDVFAWVDNEIRNAGYDNGYVGHVMGHRVYRHGPLVSRFPWFPPEQPFGWTASWHGPGFLLKVIRRWVYPEELGPPHRGPKTGMWAVEPHLRLIGFGCKFEEQFVAEDGNAYWLTSGGLLKNPGHDRCARNGYAVPRPRSRRCGRFDTSGCWVGPAAGNP